MRSPYVEGKTGGACIQESRRRGSNTPARARARVYRPVIHSGGQTGRKWQPRSEGSCGVRSRVRRQVQTSSHARQDNPRRTIARRDA